MIFDLVIRIIYALLLFCKAQSSKKCPLTGKSFKTSDILELVQSGSGFAASGPVEVKVHRPSFN